MPIPTKLLETETAAHPLDRWAALEAAFVMHHSAHIGEVSRLAEEPVESGILSSLFCEECRLRFDIRAEEALIVTEESAAPARRAGNGDL